VLERTFLVLGLLCQRIKGLIINKGDNFLCKECMVKDKKPISVQGRGTHFRGSGQSESDGWYGHRGNRRSLLWLWGGFLVLEQCEVCLNP
jgi:hypothetical protein